MSTCIVTFLPMGIQVSAQRGERLLDVALRTDLGLDHVCGGNCACTTCHVVIAKGHENLEAPFPEEEERLADLPKRFAHSRLACQTLVMSDLSVCIR